MRKNVTLIQTVADATISVESAPGQTPTAFTDGLTHYF